MSSYSDSLFFQSFFSGLLPLKLESFSPIQFLLSVRMMSHFLETIFIERKSGGLFPGLGQVLGLLFLAELVSHQLGSAFLLPDAASTLALLFRHLELSARWLSG